MPPGGSVGEGQDAEVLAMGSGRVPPQAQGAGLVGGRRREWHEPARGAEAIEGVNLRAQPTVGA
ncbi:hypothetical protein BKE38_00155 [Pseudoroseomonas deserti]|uniref:Uncharacterized protein n=1 Tax=Teichococcus deserti TaxID=1817963 RepID=A0A1V2H8J6_9PROT|nr:hypothetical protein BKE38_00155 [Pseudoroseomonas deserti]